MTMEPLVTNVSAGVQEGVMTAGTASALDPSQPNRREEERQGAQEVIKSGAKAPGKKVSFVIHKTIADEFRLRADKAGMNLSRLAARCIDTYIDDCNNISTPRNGNGNGANGRQTRKRTDPDTDTLTVYLDEVLLKRFKHMAVAQEKKFYEIMECCITAYLEDRATADGTPPPPGTTNLTPPARP